MSKKLGGGGAKCTLCKTTAYTAEQVTYEKQVYHVECFRCTKCKKKMGPSKAQLHEGNLYDNNCYKSSGFSSKTEVQWSKKTTTTTTTTSSGKFGGGGKHCVVCKKVAYPAELLTYEKKPYHRKCFKCSVCSREQTVSNVSWDKEANILYCPKCAKTAGFTTLQTNSTKTWKKSSGGGGSSKFNKYGGGGKSCTICEKAVYAGEGISYEKKIYHPKCFKCTDCSKKLGSNKASEYDGKPYCLKCFSTNGYAAKQREVNWKPGQSSGGGSGKWGGGGTNCGKCNKKVYQGEKVAYDKRAYHPNCFKCSVCDKKMKNSSSANTLALTDPSHAKKLGVNWNDEEGERNLIICQKCWTAKECRNMQTFGGALFLKKKSEVKDQPSTDKRFKAFGGGGAKCKNCSKTVYPAEKLSFEKAIYHAKCFTCKHCGKKMNSTDAQYTTCIIDGQKVLEDIYHPSCFRELGLKNRKAPTELAKSETEEVTEETQSEDTTEQEEPSRDTLD